MALHLHGATDLPLKKWICDSIWQDQNKIKKTVVLWVAFPFCTWALDKQNAVSSRQCTDRVAVNHQARPVWLETTRM